MKRFLALFTLLLAGLALPVPSHAQAVPYAGQTRFSNMWAAPNFGKWRVQVGAGGGAAGTSYSFTFFGGGYVTAGGTQSFTPFTTTTRLLVGQGTTQETVTPSAVSGCGVSSTSQCIVTATFTYAHGVGTVVRSGSGGFDEAANVANQNGGGIVLVDNNTSITPALIQASTAIFSNVTVESMLGTNPTFYQVLPTTLSALATPATRSATAGNTQVISGTATGTFAASAYFVAVTCVDVNGQESVASGSFSFTATASVALNWASPAAETGCVGWIPYAGLSGVTTMYRITPSASICTLTTLETVQPACAIGSPAVTPSPNTTSVLAPGYTVATYRLNPQSHSAAAYQPVHHTPICGNVPADWGPWTATAGGTTTQVQVVGTVSLPAGCLNQIGKTLRVSGKLVGTTGASETPKITIALGPTLTTGTPTAICVTADTTAPGAAAENIHFECTVTTNAIGTSGTLMPNAFHVIQLQAGTTAGASAVDTATAAITNDVASQDTLYVVYTGTSGTDTAQQLVQLTIEQP